MEEQEGANYGWIEERTGGDTHTSPPHTLSRCHENHCADAVNVSAYARVHLIVDNAHSRKKKAKITWLLRKKRKRDALLKDHTLRNETWNAEDWPTHCHYSPKEICSLLTISKEKHKIRTRKRTSRRYEKKRRERGNEKSTHESTALYPVVI